MKSYESEMLNILKVFNEAGALDPFDLKRGQ